MNRFPVNKKQSPPIVFIHEGASWYLPYTLHQAESKNDRSPVVLLGDSNLAGRFETADIAHLKSDRSREFASRYQHMSSNGREFELFCWLRWFYLLEYMRREGVRSAWHLDSDVLLCSSIEDIESIYSNRLKECALMVPEQDEESFLWAASGHVSFWTREMLEEFCAFCIESFGDEGRKAYHRKWEYHLKNQKKGGICDMTTLYLFWRERSDKITNLAADFERNVFDVDMGESANFSPNEYAMRSDIKEINYIGGFPHFRRLDHSGGMVRAHGLHFQGPAKLRIPGHYTGNNFNGKFLADWSIRLRILKRHLTRKPKPVLQTAIGGATAEKAGVKAKIAHS